ncbi:MAG: SPFH domain-containing protein [Bacteroidales bacterium]
MTLTVIILAALVVIFTLSGLKVVQQAEVVVIERLGKYHRTLSSGINIIWPIIDRPREICARKMKTNYEGNQYAIHTYIGRVDMREQVYDFPKQNVITRDNVQTEINALLYFQIMDPMKAIYEINDLPNAIEKLTQTTLRNVIGELELDETLTSRDTINAKLRTVLDDATNKWGVKVNRVELQDITPPDSVREAMERQMRAERTKRSDILTAEGEKKAMILKSEGEQQSVINHASGKRQSLILEAEGEANAKIVKADAEAQAINKIAKAVEKTKTDPAQFILADQYISTLKEMVSGKDNKTVYLPYEASNLLGSIGGIKDLFIK